MLMEIFVVGSSRMCYGWPLNFFFFTDERNNDNPQLVSITRVNVIIFILLISAAFTATVVVFIAVVVITV